MARTPSSSPARRRPGAETPPALIDLVPPGGLSLTSSTKKLSSLSADALVLGVEKTPDGPVVALPLEAKGLPADLQLQAEALRVSGAADEVRTLPAPSGSAWPVIVLSGLGDGRETDSRAESLRRAPGAAARALTGREHAVFALPAQDVAEAAAVAEGAALGAFTFTAQKHATRKPSDSPLRRATIAAAGLPTDELAPALTRAENLGRAVALSRTLTDLSPDTVYPHSFAELARDLAAATSTGAKGRLSVEVLAEDELAAGGYGGLMGVGQGAAHPPRLVRIGWEPAKPVDHVALVGKGITFDSGGLSLKPGASMMTMKSDMSGAATVLATVLAAAEAGLPVATTGWLCLAENMPSGTATRPGDVLRIRGGRTVEVLNTDAEGRLVLADGLVAAREEDPGLLIDIATLTGAQMIALGKRTAGVMGDDDAVEALLSASVDSGESLWPMPLPHHLRASLDSHVADLKNIGDREGGMLVAGLFLQEFGGAEHTDSADDLRPEGPAGPWAHLDIAGPSFNEDSPWGYTPRQGTGMGLLTLFRTLELVAGRPV
ncbi:putative cytosol aminopeptidase [Kocuria sp. NBRC 114282]|uniref:leucyl aminopeptidase n=1 Tax=Kocuria sp. NBRC 114282 TaxID=2994520 RepID=UPI0024A5223E|nr:leucyl aminopeptidase [Kocuria sp. NBRC 114282]GLU86856.1 putative cytosol aminopeptidase [Kocuria sp. NBRC 114282]